MPIYKINNQKIEQLVLKKNGFDNEFKLRDFFADNLEEILGIRFIEKEYTTTDGRIDTLGIDENDSPVIIEYKWKENEEVLSQGLFYLDWLLKNKKHFELLVKSKFGHDAEISWDQPRVILIAQGFSRYIKSAVQRVENVELKTYALYEGNVLQIRDEYSPFPEKEHVEKKHDKGEDKTVYDLKYHFDILSPEMQKVSQVLRDKILELPSVEEKVGQKTGISYKTTKSFTRLEFRKTWIQVLLRDYTYKADTKNLIKDISSNEWGYKGMVKFTVESDIDYVFSLIKASYNSTL